jgi:syntaxin-binding protein 5
LTERKPELTAIAVHPSGHLLATGHVDGSLVFWAVEDEDKPLFAMTLDGKQDINAANAEEMDAALSGTHTGSDHVPEPIFKLVWSGYSNSSDPRGGDTVLTVLGGLGPKDVPGVNAILLPPFDPPEPPAQTMSGVMLDPATRKAMRQTVIPKNTYCYSTVGLPQDFLLLPREQPHFSGAWDPVALLMLSNAEKDARVIEAYQFPPPLFMPKIEACKTPTAAEDTEDTQAVVEKEIACALESMQIDEGPRSLELPAALWGGPSSVTGGDLISLTRETYEILVANASSRPLEGIELRGGRAWVEDDEGQMKLMRVSYHVCFPS